jgi:hypothetical protein
MSNEVALTQREPGAVIVDLALENARLREALQRVRTAFYVDGTAKALKKALEGTKDLLQRADSAQ